MKRAVSLSVIAAVVALLTILSLPADKPASALQFPRCETLQGTSCTQELQTTSCQTFTPNANPPHTYTYTCTCTQPHVGQPGRPYAWQCLPEPQ